MIELTKRMPFITWFPLPVPAVVANVALNWILPPGPARLPMPVVWTAPGAKDTAYGMPRLHFTATVDVAVSVPRIATLLPKFIADALTEQDAVMVILVVKLNDCVAAKAEGMHRGRAKSPPILTAILPPRRIYCPDLRIQR